MDSEWKFELEMPLKRKRLATSASTSGGNPAKRPQSGTATPQAQESSDEYTDQGREASESEAENLRRAVNIFSKQSTSRREKGDKVHGVGDLSHLDLKPDHANRPLFIEERRNRITLENFSPLAESAQDFLTTIAEPLSRPKWLHEYVLTAPSLYAAVSVGLAPDDIVKWLDQLSKTTVPQSVIDFIHKCTQSFGKLKLVLKHNRYFLETSYNEVLVLLLQDEVIGAQKVDDQAEIITEKAPTLGGLVIPGTKDAAGVRQQPKLDVAQRQEVEMINILREDDEVEEDEKHIHSLEIPKANLQTVRKRCVELEYPVLEEYDFNNDQRNPNLDIDLKPNTTIRSYQEKSLSKTFSNGRCRSGIIVLPCGAGKTLVGITAACTVKKGVVILCTSSMSVVQWRNEFLKWSNISPNDIAIFTSDHKERFTGPTGIVVSTYSMVTQTRSRSYDAQKMMDFLGSKEWGLMILDEVHVVPASIFRKATDDIKSHAKLGLTATLLREDDKITDLNFLIGPKLYEANWMELADQGHIVRIFNAKLSPSFP